MDNAIESFEYYDYKPPITEHYNDWGASFPIIAYNENIVSAPGQSFLIIQGEITAKDSSADNAKVTDFTNKIKFANNGILHLFDRIEYYLGEERIDDIQRPGISTTMKGLASLERDIRYNDAGWNIQNSSASNMTTKGEFYFTIPLCLISGFFEDTKNYIYRMSQKLIFYKSTSSSATNVLIHDNKYNCEIKLKDIVWRIPQIKFNIIYDTKIKTEILKGAQYPLIYHHWRYQYNKLGEAGEVKEMTWEFPAAYARTKYILLGFQNDRENKKTADISQFDLCDLQSVQVQLNNNVYYPSERLVLNLAELKCGKLYNMFKNFKASYYNLDPNKVDPIVDYQNFLNKYPIICIDCSCQPEVIKNSLINVKIHFEWGTKFSKDAIIHCVLISDDKSVYTPLYNKAIH